MTGPKISFVMVTDLGSLVRMTVGLTKYPVDESAGCQVPSMKKRRGHTFTTGNDLTAGLLGLFDDVGDPLECGLVDDGSGEVSPLGTWADSDTIHLLNKRLLETTLPHRPGNITSCESRALLARVFEGSSDSLNDTRLDIGRGVVQVEVLSTSLTDNSGVTSVLVEVGSNLAPKTLEDLGTSGEVKTSELSVVDTLLDNLWWVSGNELDDRRGKTGLEEDLVDEVVGVGGHGGRLPDTDVSYKSGDNDQVGTDGGLPVSKRHLSFLGLTHEVEGGDGENETFKWSVLRSAAMSAPFRTRRCKKLMTYFQTPCEFRGGWIA